MARAAVTGFYTFMAASVVMATWCVAYVWKQKTGLVGSDPLLTCTRPVQQRQRTRRKERG